jgi:hypothetical protein
LGASNQHKNSRLSPPTPKYPIARARRQITMAELLTDLLPQPRQVDMFENTIVDDAVAEREFR